MLTDKDALLLKIRGYCGKRQIRVKKAEDHQETIGQEEDYEIP